MDSVVYECANMRIDLANRRLTRGGAEIALEPKAFSVLGLLLERADGLVTREEILDAVWGHRYITPATLNRVVAILRRLFGDDADHPRSIRTVHGSGYRFVGELRRIAVSQGETRAHFGPPPGAQLPAKLDRLVGRERELDQLCEMLAQHRAVTIIGAGGMGKTQCALEAARLCSARFPDGVWFFDLSPLERAHEWLRMLAAALSVPAVDTPELVSIISAALSNRIVLLVIDNCDRLATEIGSNLFNLLRSCPELRILTTSRQRLDFVGEWLLWLQPLALPPRLAEKPQVSIEEIAAFPAVELLLARAVAVQPSIALTRGNAFDIVEICHRLDGLPLALELVAAQFAMLSPTAIRERLQRQIGSLASGCAGREPRHQTIQALVNWSFGLLSSQEQRLLCWLGVFLQGWTIDAAEQHGKALGIEGERLLELHSGLILKSLVVVDPTLSPPRYRLLETVREFVLELLHQFGEEADARRAHLRYFTHLAELSHKEILELRADAVLERMRHEHANIDGALTWARAAESDQDAGLQLIGPLMLYGKCQGLLSLVAQWGDRALEGVAPQSKPAYVRALLCSGVFKTYIHDPAIEAQLNEVVELAAQIGDRWAQGCASAHLSMWNAHLGVLDRARVNARVAAELAAAEVDDWLKSLAGLAEAWIALRAHDYGAAIDILQPLRHIGCDLNQRQMINGYLALSLYEFGLWREAAYPCLNVFELSLRTRNLRSHAGGIEATAYLAISDMRPDLCARLLGKASDIRERSGAPLFNFWRASHDQAINTAREGLGRAKFDALYADGALAHDELVVEESRAFLRRLTEGEPQSSRLTAR